MRDVTCGIQVLHQAMQSDWWEWSGGSSLVFWRWNGESQIKSGRDGLRLFVSAALPTKRKQKGLKLDAQTKGLVAAKLDTMVRRG